MDLINIGILNETKNFYKLKHYGIFHQTISLIISQKISFSSSRKIRQKMFELIFPEKEFTVKNISNITKDTLISFGIDENKYETILNILKLDNSNENQWITKISKIKGIGSWTIKCLKIMFNIDNDLFLYEDLWIR